MFLFFARPCAIVLGCYLFISQVHAQTLSTGDVVIVGYNFKDPDEFSILSLVNLSPGTQFYITDCGWNSNTAALRSGEGLITYTVPAAGISAGQQMHYPADPGFMTQGVNGFFGLSAAGDQLLLFQGSFQTPRFLFGLTDYNGGWLGDAFMPTTQSSHLPPGLVDGQTALELDEYIQARFECAFPFSNREEFLNRITDPHQWIKETDRALLPITACGFDVLAVDELEWSCKMGEDKRLLVHLFSLLSRDELAEISWYCHTPEATVELSCTALGGNEIECILPESSATVLFIKPCRTARPCEPYKPIHRTLETDLYWHGSEGSLTVEIPENCTVIHTALHLVDGTLVCQDPQTMKGILHLNGLKAGFYILTVELAQVVYRIPISITE